jgi:ABC-type transporter Mla maintaining outer membrane lipid asymmetry ATPase subunit MlaF
MPPMHGTYELFGTDMSAFKSESLATRLRVGLVFQGGQMLRNLSVAENIALPLRYHKNLFGEEVEKRVKDLMEWTELTQWHDAVSSTLSLHWQKRVGLARALALEPEVLLLDLPLGGLDLRHAKWWLNFLDEFSAGGGPWKGRRHTIALTTEDLRPWRNPLCKFAVVEKQRFEAVGQRDQLARFHEPLMRELMAENYESETQN